MHLLVTHRKRVRPVERRKADEPLVHDDAERVDVRSTVHELAHGLLRRHVVRCSHRAPARGEAQLRARLGDAEVRHQRVTVLVEQHVVGFHVAVDDAPPVRVVQRRRRLRHNGRDFHGRLRSLRDAVSQRAPRQIGHDDEQHALGFAGVDNRNDVRVHELGRGARLAPKALEHFRVLREVAVEHLEHDRPLEMRVFGQVHACHAAAAESFLHLIAAAGRVP